MVGEIQWPIWFSFIECCTARREPLVHARMKDRRVALATAPSILYARPDIQVPVIMLWSQGSGLSITAPVDLMP